MNVHVVTLEAFDLYAENTLSVFHRASFVELNRSNVDELVRLIFTEGKYAVGLILGKKENVWQSPFSAPFGGFCRLNQLEPPVEVIDNMLECLTTFLNEQGGDECRLTLPPLNYDPTFLTKVQSSCLRHGFTVTDWDLNFIKNTLDKNQITRSFSRSALRNLKLAEPLNWRFEQLEGEDGLLEAYEIILRNRVQKGYRLSMTAQQLIQTRTVVSMDAFRLSFENRAQAAAIVYRHRPTLVQVIYWGDVADNTAPKGVMAYLANQLFLHYSETGVHTVDVGPAMLGNQPIYGLCDFKESIGCTIQPKCSMLWKRA